MLGEKISTLTLERGVCWNGLILEGCGGNRDPSISWNSRLLPDNNNELWWISTCLCYWIISIGFGQVTNYEAICSYPIKPILIAKHDQRGKY